MPDPEVPAPVVIEDAARRLRAARCPLLLLGGLALRQGALENAAAVAGRTGAKILAATHNARVERGAGRVAIDRLPYPVAQARALLAEVDCLVLVGAPHPVAFFAYPDQPSDLVSPGCCVLDLCPEDPGRAANAHVALAALSDAVGGTAPMASRDVAEPPSAPSGALTPDTIARSLCRWMPEQAIVAEDAVTSGRAFFPQTRHARPHDWLQTTGGAIGHGLPMATGAAVACPDRKVVCLQADGAGMYTLQALWTQAREGLDVTTVIFANRRYAILRSEFRNIGIADVGARAERLTSLDAPALDWTALARGMGVAAQAVETADAFDQALKAALETSGPFLIEARIP